MDGGIRHLIGVDQFVAFVHVDVVLVAEIRLTVLFRPAGVPIFLTTLGRLLLPRGRDLPLVHLLPLFAPHALPGNRHKARINDLPGPGRVACFPQKRMKGREQALCQLGLGQGFAE